MPEQRAQTVIALDYGPKKIGLATGNTLTSTASPLCVVPMKQHAPDWASIESHVREWKASTLIVGLPLNMDGSESAISAQAREFARALHNRTRLPVMMMDERLSTREAREQASDAGYRQGSAVDALAAQRILLSWFADPALARTP
ncbi:MAG: Holliday junction resolvase RuvX [Gammaproteobacteria bacterium]|nr:MAG: Holliday junction resolvase RuvX [Gammaproteobacteria bacterium]